MQRDRANNQYYAEQGWTVLRFWEQQVKKEFATCLNQVLEVIEDFEQYAD